MIIVGFLLLFAVFLIIDYYFFKKLGLKGWYSLIPFYRNYKLYAHLTNKTWLGVLVVLVDLSLVIFTFDTNAILLIALPFYIIQCFYVIKKFNLGFLLGLFYVVPFTNLFAKIVLILRDEKV